MKKSKQRKRLREAKAEAAADIYGGDERTYDKYGKELNPGPEQPKKLSPCPCGSGKKFKDCCRASWKRQNEPPVPGVGL